MQHHPDGSVTLTPDEADDLRALFEWLLAGNRVEATLSASSRTRYGSFLALRRGLQRRPD